MVLHRYITGNFQRYLTINELSKRKEIRLVVTEDVFEKVKGLNEKELNEFLKRGEMFVCRNVKLTFVVAEKGFTMNLYRDSYDAFSNSCMQDERCGGMGHETLQALLISIEKG